MELILKIDVDDVVTEWGEQTVGDIIRDTVEHEIRMFVKRATQEAVKQHGDALRRAAVSHVIAAMDAQEHEELRKSLG